MTPELMGLLSGAAAGLEASGPSRTPVSLGQVMSRGLLSGMGAYQAGQDQELKRGLLGVQMQHMQNQDSLLKAQIEELKRKTAQEEIMRQARANIFGDPGVSPQQALQGGGGPTLENAARIRPADPMAINPAGLRNYMALTGDTKMAEALQNMGPKWEIKDRFNDQTGRNERVLVDMRNPQNVMPFGGQEAKPLHFANVGNSIVGLDPLTGERAGSEMPISASPDALLADERTRSEGNKNRAVTVRGQDKADERAGISYDTERGLVVNTRNGTASPVMASGAPIGPKDKALTDSQSKALLFSNRMEASDKILSGLDKAGTNYSYPGMMGNGNANAIINTFASTNQQQLAQAKRDFLNAVLRRESGAVISPSEFINGDRQYFPQIGDSKEVIAQKAANRKAAIDGIKAEVPSTYSGPERRRGSGRVVDFSELN